MPSVESGAASAEARMYASTVPTLVLQFSLGAVAIGMILLTVGQITDRTWTAQTRAERRGEGTAQWDGAGYYGWHHRVRTAGWVSLGTGAVAAGGLAFLSPEIVLS